MNTLSLLKAKISGTTFLSRGLFTNLKRRDRYWVIPLAALGIGVGGAASVGMVVENYIGLAAVGGATGRPGLVIFAGLLTAWVLDFAVVFPIAISVFYLSRDSLMLAAFPIPPGRIVSVNFLMLYLYSLPAHLLLFVPAAAVYLAFNGVSPAALASTVLLAVAGSLVPAALSLLLVYALTGAVRFSTHRVAFEAFGMTLMVVALVGFQVILSRSVVARSMSGEAANDVMQHLASALMAIQTAIPPLHWAASSTNGLTGVGYLLLYLAASVATTFVVYAVVRSGYLSQVVEAGVTRTRPRRAGRPAAAAGIKRRSVVRALLDRELAILFSNSSFLFESIGEIVIFPLMLVIVVLFLPSEAVAPVLPLVLGFPYRAPAALGILVLMATINTVSASSISREGRRLGLSLALPLSGRTQLLGKLACYVVLFYPAFLINVIIVTFLLRPGVLQVALKRITGAPILFTLFLVTIYADLRRPLLDWTHPQQAMKQNMNVVVAMGLALVAVAAIAALPMVAAVMGAPGYVAILIAFAVSLAMGAAIYRPLMRYADRRYSEDFAVVRSAQ